MKTFEEFKNEVKRMADIYNQQDHWVDNKVEGWKITIKPIFGDFSDDGYMPSYCANFIVYWGGEHPYKGGLFIKYNLRFDNYTSGSTSWRERFTRKSVRGAFKKIWNI